MPSTTSTIGPLTVPVPAGDIGSRIDDPVIDGLLDFFAFFLRNSLNARLATLPVTGALRTQTSADAVPVGNRYAFDPTDPRAPRVKIKIPALFLWWDGTSTTAPQSTVYSLRRRELGLLWVYDELPTTDLLQNREGLLAAADAAIVKAAERGRHPLYSYNGGPLGQSIRVALGGLGACDFEVTTRSVGSFGLGGGGATGRATKRDLGNSDAGRDYPALRATVVVQERIGLDQMVDPGDVLHDIVVDISTHEGGDVNAMVPILSGYIPGPDGTDQDDE